MDLDQNTSMSVDLEAAATTAMKHIRCTAGTDIGMRREENQDSYGIIETDSYRFLIVADGMGGVQGGATASTMAVSIVEQLLRSKTELTSSDIVKAVGIANKLIYEKGTSDGDLNGMGTTFVGLAFIGNRMLVTNVGDSRAYRFRDNKVKRLTEDHTLVMELVRSGTLTVEQAGNHPVSHMLTRSLGPTPEIEVDCYESDDGPLKNDKYLLCSDGLYNLVSEKEMLEVLSSQNIDEATEVLIDLANQRGGTDNVTLIIVEVNDEYPEDPDRRAKYVARKDEEDTVIINDVQVNATKDESTVNGQDSSHNETNAEDVAAESILLKDPYAVPELEEAIIKTRAHYHQDNTKIEGDEDQKVSEEKIVEDVKVTENVTANTNEAETSVKTNPVVSGSFTIEDLSKNLVGDGKIIGEQLSDDEKNEPISKISTSFNLSNFSSTSLLLLILCAAGVGVAIGIIYVNFTKPTVSNSVLQNSNAAIKPTPLQVTELPPAPKFIMPEQASIKPTLSVESKSPQIDTENSDILLNSNVVNNNIESTDISKNEQVMSQIEALKRQLSLLQAQLELFNGPLTGQVGEDLRLQQEKVDEYTRKIANVRNEIDIATRKMAIWYGRKTRLQEKDLTNLASEVAVSSEEVKKAKENFEMASWSYLKEVDALHLSPSDKEQKRKVEELIEVRNQKLRELNEAVKKAIAEATHDSEKQITSLAKERDRLHEEMEGINQGVELARIILGTDANLKIKKKVEVEKSISVIEGNIKDLEIILESLEKPSEQASSIGSEEGVR